jgi:hypothetical protein
MKQFTFIIVAILFCFSTQAQEKSNGRKARKEEKRKKIDALMKQEEEGVIVYKKSFAAGLKLTSDGYGGFVEKGISKSVKKALLFQIEITERKHPKEEKQPNPYAPTVPIIYAKQNFFYPVKLGVQLQMLLGNKSSKNGVSITGNLGGGLVIGLLRPYELEVDKNGVRTYVRYDSPDSNLFINGPYYGGPNFSRGWNHLKVTPGVFVKPAVRFDYGRFNEMINALEVGLTGEFYAKKIPQMVYQKQRQFFFSAYVALVFGKRK